MCEISHKMYCLKYVNEVLKMFVKTSYIDWCRSLRPVQRAALCGLILTGPLNTFSRSTAPIFRLGEKYLCLCRISSLKTFIETLVDLAESSGSSSERTWLFIRMMLKPCHEERTSLTFVKWLF